MRWPDAVTHIQLDRWPSRRLVSPRAEESHMSSGHLRPTFRVSLAASRDVAIKQIRRRLTEDDSFAGRWRGKGRWAEIHVPHSERKLWSPHVSLRLDDEEEGRCVVLGRFAPHPEVWTFFMFLYIGLAFAVVFGAVLGYVQWVSNESPFGFLAIGFGVPAIGLIHLASAAGQRLGQRQMAALKGEVDGVLEGLDPQDVEAAPGTKIP